MADLPTGARFRFDAFELAVDEGALRRDGEPVPLQDLPLRLLAHLIERAPEVVTRAQLREALWAPDTHVDVDASLNTAVARVREALGDAASDPRFVATVPRRGYRFIGEASRRATTEPPPTQRRRPQKWIIASLGIASLLLAVVAWRVVHETTASDDGRQANLAREHLLIARHHADKRSREGLEKAIASFQSAVALAPDSAEAYAGLASTYALLGIYDFWRPREAFEPATTMATRALQLDTDSAEAHLATGLVAAVGQWDWEDSQRAMRRAMELAPDSADVNYWTGSLLSALGRHDEAVQITKAALELDPTSAVINTALAWRLFQARRGDEAMQQALRATELSPNYYDAWDNLKWIARTLEREPQAVQAWIRAEELDGGDGSGIARVYAASGLAGLHRASIKSQLHRWETGKYQSPYDVALEYAALGDTEAAFTWLERSMAERETDLAGMGVDPRMDGLRGQVRFHEMVAEVGALGRVASGQ